MRQKTFVTTDKEKALHVLVDRVRAGDQSLYLQVVSALRSSNSNTVIGAALVLARVKDRSCLPNLLEAFQTKDPSLGAALAYALGELGAKEALPWLCAALEHGFVQGHVCEALGKIGSAEAFRPLCAALHTKQQDVRVKALKSLAALDFSTVPSLKEEVVRVLQEALQSAEPKLRMVAARSLTHLENLT